MTQTLTAQDMFRAAYENRYTWDANFPGYRAKVTLQDGRDTYTGQVQINPDLTFAVLNIADERAQRQVKSQLWEMTVHRARRSFEESHGDNTFALGKTDETGAIEILVGGADVGNRYKVRDNTVCFVHRQIRDVVVNIHTFDLQMTDCGYLATGYRSVYLDPETGLANGAETRFTDTFKEVGDYYLLTHRFIRTSENDTPKTIDIQFSKIKLL